MTLSSIQKSETKSKKVYRVFLFAIFKQCIFANQQTNKLLVIIHSFNRSFRHHVSICRHNRQINVQRDDSAFFAARNAAAQQQIKFVHILAKIRGRTGQSACY